MWYIRNKIDGSYYKKHNVAGAAVLGIIFNTSRAEAKLFLYRMDAVLMIGRIKRRKLTNKVDLEIVEA